MRSRLKSAPEKKVKLFAVLASWQGKMPSAKDFCPDLARLQDLSAVHLLQEHLRRRPRRHRLPAPDLPHIKELKRVAIFQMRCPRFSSLFSHMLIPNPAPTFGKRALSVYFYVLPEAYCGFFHSSIGSANRLVREMKTVARAARNNGRAP